jgi:site-specific recombinase XerD
VILYLPPMKGHKGLQRSGLESDQMEAFLTRLVMTPEPSRTILRLLPETGLRISEIVSLKGNNLQRAGKHTVFRFSGKGQKIRTVPLNKNALSIWRDYKKSGYAPTIKPHTYLFSGKKPNTHITARAVTHHTAKIAALEPLLGGLSPHVLRHTFATRAIQKGASVAHVMQLLGHSNIATTQRYLHPTLSDLASIVDAF